MIYLIFIYKLYLWNMYIFIKVKCFWNREVWMCKDNVIYIILNDLGDVLVYGIIFNFYIVI